MRKEQLEAFSDEINNNSDIGKLKNMRSGNNVLFNSFYRALFSSSKDVSPAAMEDSRNFGLCDKSNRNIHANCPY